jgi:hypothetical protein
VHLLGFSIKENKTVTNISKFDLKTKENTSRTNIMETERTGLVVSSKTG